MLLFYSLVIIPFYIFDTFTVYFNTILFDIPICNVTVYKTYVK